MKEWVLIFDIPREMNTQKVRVWRELNKLRFQKIQHSVWKSNDLDKLMKIAMFIKKSGGEARILEEKFVL